MKKVLLYTTAFMLTAGIFSCGKKLDLVNPQSIDAEVIFDTDSRVKGVLVGTYAVAGSASLLGGDAIWMSELMASDGELNWVGTFPDPRQIWGKTILVNNGYVRSNYQQSYITIFNCNNILANLGVVASADKGRVEGEAKFLRGLAYFNLITFFGEKPYSFGNTALKGVPLITDPRPADPLSIDNFVERSTIEQVYTQIIKDFTEAETLLPAKNGFYANKPSASLALARVYLQQGKFAEARDAANRCIGTATANGFSLVSDFENEFNTDVNTSEDLFAMQVNTQGGSNSCFTFFSTTTYGARDGDIQVTDKHIAKYSANDLRLDLFFEEVNTFYCGKWRDAYMNVKVLRLAEAYLIRAEGNVRLGTAVGATVSSDLHRTRGRAGLVLLAAPTLNDVLAEREKELAFEGQGLNDVKRLKLTTDGLPYDDNKMVFPIPQRETNIYNVGQNPGYF